MMRAAAVRSARFAVVALALFAAMLSARGQSPAPQPPPPPPAGDRGAAGPGPQDALAEIRKRGDLSDDDRNQIRTFIGQRVAEIAGGDAVASQAACAALRAGYAGTEGFTRAYGALALEVIGSAYRKAEIVPAAKLLAVLSTFNLADAQGLFVEALQDERVGVRASAALGLRALRAKLAPTPAYAATATALAAAGKKEKSRETLRSIYEALDYSTLPTPPDLKPAATALLELLEERAKEYAARGEVPAVGADDAGLAVAARLSKPMGEEERKRLLVVTATMVRYAIEQYRSTEKGLTELRDKTASPALLEYRNGMERLVLVGEPLLGTLLAVKEKGPNVMEAMRQTNRANMKLEWDKWAGMLRTATNQDFALLEQVEPATTQPAQP